MSKARRLREERERLAAEEKLEREKRAERERHALSEEQRQEELVRRLVEEEAAKAAAIRGQRERDALDEASRIEQAALEAALDETKAARAVAEAELAELRPMSRLTGTRDLASADGLRNLHEHVKVSEYSSAHGSDFARLAVARSILKRDRKPFLGGFRDKKSGLEYHHGSTQTPRMEAWGKAPVKKCERESQTVDTLTTGYQPPREVSTQVDRPGVFRNRCDTDKIIVTHVGKYEPYATLFKKQVRAVLLMQRIARGWLARRRVRQMREEKAAEAARHQGQVRELEMLRRQNFQDELERKRNPRTKADFEQLYAELDEWVQQEKRRINIEFEGDESGRKKALVELLSQQTRVIHTIDKLKAQAAVENKANANRRKLKDVSRANQAVRADGTVVKVHTEETLHARSLRKLYIALTDPLPLLDARLETLLQVKEAVQDYDCELTDDILDLIERESQTLAIGRSEKMLAGVRKRLSTLFLQFIETPEFNPAAERSAKVRAKRTSTLGAPTRADVTASKQTQ